MTLPFLRLKLVAEIVSPHLSTEIICRRHQRISVTSRINPDYTAYILYTTRQQVVKRFLYLFIKFFKFFNILFRKRAFRFSLAFHTFFFDTKVTESYSRVTFLFEFLVVSLFPAFLFSYFTRLSLRFSPEFSKRFRQGEAAPPR